MELERIEKENLKIAQKIYELKPCMMVNELEHEFKQHKKYSESIRRLKKKKLPKFNGRPGHLPPLEDEQEDDPYVEKDKEKKDVPEVAMSMEVKPSGEDLTQQVQSIVEGEEAKQLDANQPQSEEQKEDMKKQSELENLSKRPSAEHDASKKQRRKEGSPYVSSSLRKNFKPSAYDLKKQQKKVSSKKDLNSKGEERSPVLNQSTLE
mmetsp:Transcript_2460/g.2408  ORF Transcript_2460/g.2408 Transcript_2460/m.2408 type:complete len:207 (-) Transcript_2460:62-682(-)